jgi:hypothetical protein
MLTWCEVDSQAKGKGCSTTTFVPFFQKERDLYKYINKDGIPSTKSTRHVNANVNTRQVLLSIMLS